MPPNRLSRLIAKILAWLLMGALVAGTFAALFAVRPPFVKPAGEEHLHVCFTAQLLGSFFFQKGVAVAGLSLT